MIFHHCIYLVRNLSVSEIYNKRKKKKEKKTEDTQLHAAFFSG